MLNFSTLANILFSLRNDNVKHVFVGEDKASFYVHENILCSASPFFKAAFNGNFKEAAEGDISLPEDDPETFERFLQYLYTKSYNLSSYATDKLEACQRQTWEYVKLYVFAEKAQVEPLQHHIIRGLFALEQKKHTKYPVPYECIKYAYDHTMPGSPLRRILAATYVWHTQVLAPKLLANTPDLAADVACGLQKRLHGMGNLGNPFDGTADYYVPNTLT